jgi:hypothetical protein
MIDDVVRLRNTKLGKVIKKHFFLCFGLNMGFIYSDVLWQQRKLT